MKIKLNVYLVLLLVLAALIAVPTAGYAEDGEPYQPLAKWFGVEDGDDAGMIQQLDLPAQVHYGIEIQLREALLDGNQLYLSTYVVSDRIEDLYDLQFGSDVNLLWLGMESFPLEGFDRYDSALSDESEILRPGAMQLVLTAEIPDEFIHGDELDLSLSISKISARTEEGWIEFGGSWYFNFLLDLDARWKSVRKIAVDRPILVDDRLIVIDTLTLTPFGARAALTLPIVRQGEAGTDADRRQDLYNSSLLGFVLSDDEGNRTHLDTEVYTYWGAPPDEDTPLHRGFRTDAEANGWSWLKDAEYVTLTPYVATAAGPSHGGEGIERYMALEPIRLAAGDFPTELDRFMFSFEPEYIVEDPLLGSLDTSSPYVKPVRHLHETKAGTALMLDKVLVTENDLFVTVLMGLPEALDQEPSDFQIGSYTIEVGPRIPYPENYFKPRYGGGGGGGPYLHKLNDDPFVAVDSVRSDLMFLDDYVSASDPIQVRLTIQNYQVCWGKSEAEEDLYFDSHCFRENGEWTFEFETDGAELAAKTEEFDLDETLTVGQGELSLYRLRFNPMQLIFFVEIENSNWADDGMDAIFARTDDGKTMRLGYDFSPFRRLSRKIVDPELIASLEKTETLTLFGCGYPEFSDYTEFPEDFDPEDPKFYDCEGAQDVVIALP